MIPVDALKFSELFSGSGTWNYRQGSEQIQATPHIFGFFFRLLYSIMAGIIGIIASLTVLGLSLVITRLATVSLNLTGLSWETAKFQARSAFTGNGNLFRRHIDPLWPEKHTEVS
ncbi:MAG: hypothetical protein R6U40_00800 [Desulfobacterales bacterium]